MRKWFAALIAVCLALVLAGCGSADQAETDQPEETGGYMQIAQEEAARIVEEDSGANIVEDDYAEESALVLFIDGEALDVSWENNDSVASLQELVRDKPLEVQMSMYGGFEQVGSLGADIPRSDEQTTTQAGDIVLYQGNQIVVFYGSNSWSYTRLGHIEGKTAEALEQLLGERDVTLTLEVT